MRCTTSISRFSCICFLLTFAFFNVTNSYVLAKEYASTVRDGINLRSGPGKNFDIVSEIGSGFPFEIVGKEKNWIKVKDFENDEGWVYKTFITTEKRVIVNVNKNSDDPVNLRKDPQAKSPIIGKAHYGVVFKLLQVKDGWAEVQHDSGLRGWMRTSLLWGAGI